jgi:hypothetical protein
MHLALRRPSAEWIRGVQPIMDSAGATHALLVTLEVGQYWLSQRGILGRKRVELGTGHLAAVPWLTSLETPVTVLQLTGVVVSRDGRGTRIGAEGIMATRTGIVASAFGAQRPISDEDVARVRTAPRADLPGEPLAWTVALSNLVAGVTGR